MLLRVKRILKLYSDDLRMSRFVSFNIGRFDEPLRLGPTKYIFSQRVVFIKSNARIYLLILAVLKQNKGR